MCVCLQGRTGRPGLPGKPGSAGLLGPEGPKVSVPFVPHLLTQYYIQYITFKAESPMLYSAQSMLRVALTVHIFIL